MIKLNFATKKPYLEKQKQSNNKKTTFVLWIEQLQLEVQTAVIKD